MPTTLSPVDVANLALSKIGAAPINSLLDSGNSSAVQCNNNLTAAYLEVIRLAPWSCLLTPANLTAIPQVPLPGSDGAISSITATPWEPLTYYAANSFVTFNNVYYQVNFDYTSSASFPDDVNNGNFTQTDQNTWSANWAAGWQDGAQFVSGWPFQYALPDDFQLLVTLNDQRFGWWQYGDSGADYQIMGSSLYCKECQAVIKYVQSTIDTTRFDSLLTNCVALKLGAMIATALRQDGGAMELKLTQGYELALREARSKNAGEKRSRPFNPIVGSRFNRARQGGQNG